MNLIFLKLTVTCFIAHNSVNATNSTMHLTHSASFYLDKLKEQGVEISLEEFTESTGSYLTSPAFFVSAINAELSQLTTANKVDIKAYFLSLKDQGPITQQSRPVFNSIERFL